jgi:hypothetical protein
MSLTRSVARTTSVDCDGGKFRRLNPNPQRQLLDARCDSRCDIEILAAVFFLAFQLLRVGLSKELELKLQPTGCPQPVKTPTTSTSIINLQPTISSVIYHHSRPTIPLELGTF